MRNGIRFLTVALFALCTQAQADTALGEINIRLYGNIVDFTCVAKAATATRPSRWARPTKQLSTTGSRTQPMPFTLKLTVCQAPPSLRFRVKPTGAITVCWR
jgi:minor fimbrial subunit